MTPSARLSSVAKAANPAAPLAPSPRITGAVSRPLGSALLWGAMARVGKYFCRVEPSAGVSVALVVLCVGEATREGV